jgi:hypothetical protein
MPVSRSKVFLLLIFVLFVGICILPAQDVPANRIFEDYVTVSDFLSFYQENVTTNPKDASRALEKLRMEYMRTSGLSPTATATIRVPTQTAQKNHPNASQFVQSRAIWPMEVIISKPQNGIRKAGDDSQAGDGRNRDHGERNPANSPARGQAFLQNHLG